MLVVNVTARQARLPHELCDCFLVVFWIRGLILSRRLQRAFSLRERLVWPQGGSVAVCVQSRVSAMLCTAATRILGTCRSTACCGSLCWGPGCREKLSQAREARPAWLSTASAQCQTRTAASWLYRTADCFRCSAGGMTTSYFVSNVAHQRRLCLLASVLTAGMLLRGGTPSTHRAAQWLVSLTSVATRACVQSVGDTFATVFDADAWHHNECNSFESITSGIVMLALVQGDAHMCACGVQK